MTIVAALSLIAAGQSVPAFSPQVADHLARLLDAAPVIAGHNDLA